MFKKEYFIGMLVAFLCLGLFGTALASDGDGGKHEYVSSEAGDLGHDSSVSEAARTHAYNQEQLAAVGTEAGNWEYDFDAPDTKASEAARSHQYDQEELASIGSEAGNWEHNFDSSRTESGGAVAAEGLDTMCSEC